MVVSVCRTLWSWWRLSPRAMVLLLLINNGEGRPQGQQGAISTGAGHAVVARIQSGLALDGILNEPEWESASSIGEIVQREPHPGEPSSERTTVKLLYDGEHLYIGVMCFDSDPRAVIATQMARDGDLSSDDRIEILLDTFRDQRNAFYFATNPAGALVDALITENGQFNREWDAIWDVRTHRSDNGWSAEFAIPFKSLSFKRRQSSWGFNFSRTIKRKIEEDRWAAPRLDVRFSQVSEAGEISGLNNLAQGKGLDIRASASAKTFHNGVTNNLSGKSGADIFYNVTPSLKWTTTVNPDFGETEADARQVNLTRFPLFFPEKRAFFLENAGVFNFSTNSRELIPFFSRRIGLSDGNEVPILAGTKLTGKIDRYDVGILDVRTRAAGSMNAKNFFVARVKRNIADQSYIGGIVTDGNPAEPFSSRTYGADLHLATSHFLNEDRNFAIDLFGLQSRNEGVNDRDAAFGATVSYPNDLWNFQADWRQIGRNFRPALGFVSRSGVRKLSLSADFSPRPKGFLNIRQMFHEFRLTRFTRLENGRVESWRIFTAPVNYELNSGEHVEFNYAPQFERLFAPFEIAKGVVLPPGDYRFTRWRFEVNTASKRRWKFDNAWWFGSFYSGHASQVESGFEYKIAPHFQARLSLDQTFAKLKQGNFVTRTFELRADYSITPFITISNLAQFDNESRNLGLQSRVRWILRPGNELFLVLNQGWIQREQGGLNFRAAGTKATGKLQYTFRF